MVFDKSIDRAEPAEEVKQRVLNLIDGITYSVYVYTTRGLFEKDKIIFTAQMTFLVKYFITVIKYTIIFQFNSIQIILLIHK